MTEWGVARHNCPRARMPTQRLTCFAVTQAGKHAHERCCMLARRTRRNPTQSRRRGTRAASPRVGGRAPAMRRHIPLGLAQAGARPWTGWWRRGATTTRTKCPRSRRSRSSVSAASPVGARRPSGQARLSSHMRAPARPPSRCCKAGTKCSKPPPSSVCQQYLCCYKM